MHSTGKILKSLITLPDNNDSCWEWNGSVLTENQVNEIKNMLKIAKWGDRQKIANTYNVSAGLISDIKYGRAWAD